MVDIIYERQDYDEIRDSEINKRGIAVIRFTNEEIDKNLEGVIYNLEDIIKDRENDLGIIPASN